MVTDAPPYVLVVEDDPTVSEVVVRYLEREGLTVDTAADGPTALRRAEHRWPDLVVLDLMLPGLDGIEVCRRLRAVAPVPVIMLTARGDEDDRVVGLDLGADDYITKPFSPRELTARVKAVLRRAAGPLTAPDLPNRIETDGLTIEVAAHEVRRNGDLVALTAREFDLLVFLGARPRRTFRREELLEQVWGYTYGDSATVTVHVRRLREKIEVDPSRPAPPQHRLGRRLPVGSVIRSRVTPFVIVAVGAVLSIGAAAATSMSSSDALKLCGLAAGTGLVAVLVGAAALKALRTRTVGTQVAAVALTTVVALMAGAFAAAESMFISSHDLSALLVILLAAGTVGVAASFVLGARVERASRSLGEVARRIARGERNATAPPLAGPEELNRLGTELAEMERRLDETQRRERTLEASRRELVGWVSHDLRTPLAGIRAMAEALEDGVVDDDATVDRYHRRIREEADHLAALVDDLFELSRTHAGGLRLEFDTVSLADLVSDALSGSAPIAAAKGVRLDGRMVGPPPQIEASAPEVLRVLRNLLENAIRHTPARRECHRRGGNRHDSTGLRLRVGARRRWRRRRSRPAADLRHRLSGRPVAWLGQAPGSVSRSPRDSPTPTRASSRSATRTVAPASPCASHRCARREGARHRWHGVRRLPHREPAAR